MATMNIKEALKNGVVTFSYTKKDGSVRVAKGTTKNTTLMAKGVQSKGGENKVAAAGYTSYYDIDKKGWRAFAESKLVSIIKVEEA